MLEGYKMYRYHVEIIGINEEKGEVYGYVEGEGVRIDPFVIGVIDWKERDNILGKYVL